MHQNDPNIALNTTEEIAKYDQVLLSLYITANELPLYYHCEDDPTKRNESFADRCVNEYMKDVDFWIYDDELKQARCDELSADGKEYQGCEAGIGAVYNSIN